MLTMNDGRAELWQWDTGRTLAVDADCSQVHFSNKVFGRSIDVDVTDGAAIIPDILLQTDKDLNVWAFVGTAENGYTKISKTFKVNRRNKPADYVFTPVEQTTIAEIAAIAQSVRDDADAGRFNGAQGPIGPQGPQGAPGANGKDAVVDSTLTQSGQAADAQAVGDKFRELSDEKANQADVDELKGDLVQTESRLSESITEKIDKPKTTDDNKFPRAKNGSVEWVEQGLPTDEQTSSAVSNWLDEHPDATTTVVDGSITKNKLANGVIPYVTPEMYGAVGDGVTDDTFAVQSAFDSGLKVVCCGKYLISKSITIEGKQNVHIDASSSFFIYSGYDYAFSFKAITFSELRFGVIEARNGGCISIKSETSDDWSQYVNIYGIRFTAHTNCILAEVKPTGSWVTECRIHDMNMGMFKDTENTIGIRMDALRTNTNNGGGIDGWKIQNVGFEGLDTCIKAKNSGFIGVYHCRTSESISHIFDFTDSTYAHSFIMVSNDILIRSLFDLMSENTYGKVICDRFYNGKKYIRDGFLVNKGDILYNNSFGYINIINSITELGEDCVANILSLNGAVRDVKLGVQYGREYGVNSFKLNSWGDVGVKLMDREGNEIFEITSENKGKTYQFNYYSDFGWEHHEIISDQVINRKFKELDEKSTISELKSFSATIDANSDSWIKNINNKKIIGIVSDNSNIIPRISFSGNNSQVYAKNNANTDITCNIYYYEFL